MKITHTFSILRGEQLGRKGVRKRNYFNYRIVRGRNYHYDAISIIFLFASWTGKNSFTADAGLLWVFTFN